MYCLDRLSEPSDDFYRIQRRAAEELGTTLHYRQIDVRDVPQLNEIVANISEKEGRMDGLVAAAGIQQETTALDYSQKDANTMFEVNITGVFMTAQAVAKQMIKHGNGGSMAFIASMSGSVANRVRNLLMTLMICSCVFKLTYNIPTGPYLLGLQCLQSWRDPTRPQPRLGVGSIRHSRQHNLTGLYCHSNGGSSL